MFVIPSPSSEEDKNYRPIVYHNYVQTYFGTGLTQILYDIAYSSVRNNK